MSSAKESPASNPGTWFALEVVIESEAQEAVQYGLMEAGAAGVECLDRGEAELSTVVAYFRNIPAREAIRSLLLDALRIYGLASSSIRDMQLQEVIDKDWLAEWKESWKPVRIGSRIVVAPSWQDTSDYLSDRLIIRIDPGMAFGTGTHETTRLCLLALEKYFVGQSLLDLGTGTGILAIAATKMFPGARVLACDTDSDAVEIAKRNAEINGVADLIDFWNGSLAQMPEPQVDFVCSNLTADLILELIPDLVRVAQQRLLLSGILEEQFPEIADKLSAAGRPMLELMREGEWVAIIA